MAHQRNNSAGIAADAGKEPHPISLKVLRLSRPTLTTQHPLPTPTTSLSSAISPTASVSYPSAVADNNPFTINPLLTLPPAFGNAYVGETFSCTLCANNELPTTSAEAVLSPPQTPTSPASATKQLTNVRIEAVMKTPTISVPLDVSFTSSGISESETSSVDPSLAVPQLSTATGQDLEPAESLQGVITYHLREEGAHVLAVTVSYNENSATQGRVRTFRKLYQFVARPCLVVRTKVSSFAAGKGQGLGRWALEAQLENVGEAAIVLTKVRLETKEWCNAKGLNWDETQVENRDTESDNLGEENPILSNGDVQQVCFLVEQAAGEVGEKKELDVAGRLIIGILNITWRGAMGNIGSLSTGWLGIKT